MSAVRIAFISGFDFPFGTETHFARDAEAVGCEVVRISERVGFEALDYTVRSQAPFDLVLYMKHHGVRDGDLCTVWDWCRSVGIPTASYHLDLYAGLARAVEIGVDPMWKTDFVFTADGDPTTRDLCEVLGIDHRWLPAAVVSDETLRGRYRPELARDVVFVGSSTQYHREWPWRQQLIEGLHAKYRDRFRVWGHHDVPLMRGQMLNDLYASVKVVVGDSLALPGHANYWSDRYYETIGRGGFLVAPYVIGLDAHLEPGKHYFAYTPGEFDQVVQLVDAAVALDDGRDAIARAGHARVVAQHTYQHRVRHLLQEVGL